MNNTFDPKTCRFSTQYRIDNDSAWTLAAIRSITTKEQLAEAVKWFVKTMKDGNRLTVGQHQAIKETLEDKAEKLGLSPHDLNRMIDT